MAQKAQSFLWNFKIVNDRSLRQETTCQIGRFASHFPQKLQMLDFHIMMVYVVYLAITLKKAER